MNRKSLFWLWVAGLIVGACTPRSTEASYMPYSVQLEDTQGNRLRTFAHRGQLFALGHYGRRYNIRLTNHTPRRVEAVVSVDGRDVITGGKGDYKHQRGYLLDAHASILIEGFRTSLHGVAAFRFTNPADSYSSRMGTPENVGVIGAAFFPEKRREHLRTPYAKRTAKGRVRPQSMHEAPPRRAPAAGRGTGPSDGLGSAAQAERAPSRSLRHPDFDAEPEAEGTDNSNIGTQYGEHRDSHVREVKFERQRPRRPHRIVSLRYDDAQGLSGRGIQFYPHQHPAPQGGPQAFPLSRFAPPPPPVYYR